MTNINEVAAMVNVLAIDTTTDACSVAVTAAAGSVDRSVILGRKHAEALVPMIVEVMQEAGLEFQHLDLLAVTVGPGSFTGLRVGLATARGFGLATGLPCLGVTSFDAVIASCVSWLDARACDGVLIAMDTRRGDVYAQVFDAAGQPLTEPFAASFEDVGQRLPAGSLAVAGDAAAPAAQYLAKLGRAADVLPVAHPQPLALAALAAQRWRAGILTPEKPTPFYLRAPKTGTAKAVKGS